jgi:uncharacterized membrane protein YjjB (DUF3815 family)
MLLAQMVTSFIAAATFALLFNAPRNMLINCGFVGMVSWTVYYLLVERGVDAVAASLVASFVVAVISQLFAKRFKTPVIIFNISGIITLVPGGLAYDAMRHFVLNDYNVAMQLAAKVLLIAGGIAVGLVLSEVLNQVLTRTKKAN